jgi:hypothetical protein
MSAKVFVMAHDLARRRAMQAVSEAPAGYVVQVSEPTRSSAENALLHAMLGYIAKHHEWAGKKRDTETWKRLLIAAWSRATGEHVELLPALDGHGVDIVFRRSSQMSRKECADLIEFVYAWGAENDVNFPPKPLPSHLLVEMVPG